MKNRLSKIQASTLSAAIVTAMTALALTCCNPIPQAIEARSNLTSTDEQAAAAIKLQHDQTEIIKLRISKIRRALEPIEDYLDGINRAVETTRRQKAGDAPLRISSFLKGLQENLLEATRGDLIVHDENSWTLLKANPFAGSLDHDRVKYANSLSEIKLEGKTQGKTERLTLSFLSRETKQWVVIARIAHSHRSSLEMNFSPKNLSEFLPERIALDPSAAKGDLGACRYRIKDELSQLECEPFTIGEADSDRILISELFIRSRPDGIEARLKAALIQHNGEQYGELDLTGPKPKFTRTRESNGPTESGERSEY